MSRLLHAGSSGPEVARLQKLLNSKLTPSPKLPENGIFGPATKQAVTAYQKGNWLVADGIVGPCTRAALEGTEKYNVYKPPPRLIPQPDETTCWAASTAMLTGKRVDQVITESKNAGVDIDGGLSNDSEGMYYANTTLLAKTFGLTVLSAQSWLPEGIARMMQAHGMLMMDTLWDTSDYVAGKGSPGHMRIIAGIRGDGTSEGTTLLLYDPWAPNKGKIEPVIYGPFLMRNLTSTYQLFYK